MNNQNNSTNDKLLPKDFSEYIGQERAKSIVKDAILSSIKRDTSLEHILLSGGAGCGKTTLALLVAKERNVFIKVTTGGSLEKAENIYNLFEEIKDKKDAIIFIDEIHSIPKGIAEILYLPMEHPDCEIQLPKKSTNSVSYWIGKQENTKMKIPPFTLFGASAGEEGELEKPFRDRFGLRIVLEKYTMANMETIIAQSCKKLEINLNRNIIKAVAERSCFIPRTANNLLKRIREHMDAVGQEKPSLKMVEKVFQRLGLDHLGIDDTGRKILLGLYNSPKKALGLNSLSKIVQLSTVTINSVVEPQLLQHGLISYMPSGRALTEAGYKHLVRLGLAPK